MEAEPKILVVGCGGAGGNMVSKIVEAGIKSIEAVAVNTDAQDLLSTSADRKVLIGRRTTEGLGAGNDPDKGEEAAVESKDLLKDHLYGWDMIFMTCGLGGGTGTGAGPVVAEIAKRFGALTVGVVTLPLEVEGRRKIVNADRGLRRILEAVDTAIIIPNDNILKIVPDIPIESAFEFADEVLIDAIRGITELVTKPGLINLDFSDVRTALQDGGIMYAGVGEASGRDRSLKAAEKALKNPLLETDVSESKTALINVTGCPEMNVEEAEAIIKSISDEIGPQAQITWGTTVSDELKNSIKVMVLISGARSPWERGAEEKLRMDEMKERLESLRYTS